MNEFNFIKKGTSEEDKDLFFGPFDLDEVFIEIEDDWTMADIVCIMNIFPSLTQARKNNFGGPIPLGFSDKRIGKAKYRCTIFKEIK